MITVNNVFAHFVKEISVTKYESDKELIPTFSPYEILWRYVKTSPCWRAKNDQKNAIVQ